ncbi:MAG: hydrogenase iron-sulfur subunit [Candidatus Bathyarchaeota archaeon]|nr:hydrogenase iron-sulfur subunit [Candidatus Bathyarchaeota archaeon]
MSFVKPKIVCFVCNWAFSDQELSFSGIQKVAKVNVVNVKCIGRLDPVIVLEAFIKGVEGVLLVGCAPPDCHFIEGYIYAQSTVYTLKKLLALANLEPERLRLRLVSPLEEIRFVKILGDFVEQLERLGPSPLSKEKYDAKVFENVLAAKNVAASFRLKAWIGKEAELTRTGNVYGKRFSKEEFETLLEDIIKAEFIRHKILLLTKKKPSSVKELAEILNMKPAIVLRHILNMRRKGMIALDSVDGVTPLYKAMEVQ